MYIVAVTNKHDSVHRATKHSSYEDAIAEAKYFVGAYPDDVVEIYEHIATAIRDINIVRLP